MGHGTIWDRPFLRWKMRQRQQRESALEAAFNKAVEAQGWESCKFVSPSHNGRLDRIVLADCGVAALAEVKRDQKADLSALQAREIKRQSDRGFIALKVADETDIARFVHAVRQEVERRRWAGKTLG